MSRASVLLLVSLVLGVSSPVVAAEVVINASQNLPTVSRALLRGIFGMRVRAWPDGSPVQVFVLDDAAVEHEEFCKSLLRMYPYQLRQSWDRLVYSGTGQRPTIVASPEDMLLRVAETPGAIGYIGNRAQIDAFENLEVLNVE